MTLDLVKTVLCIGMLAYASTKDYRSREVSNWLWLIFWPTGIALNVTEAFLFKDIVYLSVYASSFLIIFTLALALFYFGIRAVAQEKAFITLSLVLPQTPSPTKPYLQFPVVFPLSVFLNTVLIASAFSLIILIRNIWWRIGRNKSLFNGFEDEPFWKKILVMLSSVKIDVKKLKGPPFQYLSEEITPSENRITRKLLVSYRVDENDEKVNLQWLKKLAEEGRIPNELWVSPSQPMLVFTSMGFAVTILLGDVLMWIITQIAMVFITLA